MSSIARPALKLAQTQNEIDYAAIDFSNPAELMIFIRAGERIAMKRARIAAIEQFETILASSSSIEQARTRLAAMREAR